MSHLPTTDIHDTGSGVVVQVKAPDGTTVCEWEASKQHVDIAMLLLEARQEIAQQHPVRALELVLDAVRQTRGETAIMHVLAEAKHLHQQQLEQQQQYYLQQQQQREEALYNASSSFDSYGYSAHDYDDGSNYYANASEHAATTTTTTSSPSTSSMLSIRQLMGFDDQCSGDTNTDDQQPPMDCAPSTSASTSTSHRGSGEALLMEQGRTNVLQEAYSDGSSVLCPYCHGLVAKRRYTAHTTSWCPGLHLE
jgi:Tfp pilus assembly protein PilV